MICPRCNEYFLDIEYQSHRIDHLEHLMTAFTDVQSVVDAATADVSSAAARIQASLNQLNGTVDLTGLQAAVATLSNIVPAPVEPSE